MSGNMYMVIVLLLGAIAFVADTLYVTWLYFRIRAKGYRSPLVVVAVAVPAFLGFFGGIILYATLDSLINTNSFSFRPDWVRSSILHFLLYFYGSMGAVALAMGVAAWSLPVRAARSFGARRVAFPGGG